MMLPRLAAVCAAFAHDGPSQSARKRIMLEHLLPLVSRITEAHKNAPLASDAAVRAPQAPAPASSQSSSPLDDGAASHSAAPPAVAGGFSAFMRRQQQTLARRDADTHSVQQQMDREVAASRRGMSKGTRRMLANGEVNRPSVIQTAQARAADSNQEESKAAPNTQSQPSSWQDSPPRKVRPLQDVLAALAPAPSPSAAHSPAVQSRASAPRSAAPAATGGATVEQVLAKRAPRDADTVKSVLAGTWTYPGQGDSLYAAALQQRSRLAAAQQAAEAEAQNSANQRKQSAGSARLVARRLAAEVCSAVVDSVWKGLSARGHAGATWVLLQRDCWWYSLLSLPEVVAVACALGFFSCPWEALLRGILAQEEAAGQDSKAAAAQATAMGPAWGEAAIMRAVWKALVGGPVASPHGSDSALPTPPGEWAVPRAEAPAQTTEEDDQTLDITWCVRAGRVLSLLRQLVSDGAAPGAAELQAGGARTGLLSSQQASTAWSTGVQGLTEADALQQQQALGEMAEHVYGLGLAGAFLPPSAGGARDSDGPSMPAGGIPECWPDALISKCRPLYSARLSHLRSMKYKGDERGVTLATHRTAPGAAHGDKGTAASSEQAPSFAPLLCKRSMQLAEGGALPGAGKVPLHTAQAMVAAAQSKHPQVSHSYTLMAYGEAKAAKAAAAKEAADAHEMRECSFEPNTGVTRKYTAAVSAMHQQQAESEVSSALGVNRASVKVAPRAARAMHLQRLHQRHQARMDALRAAAEEKARAQEEAELAECTFAPAVNPRSALVEASRRRSAAAAASGHKLRPGASVPTSTAPRPKGYAAHLSRQARSRAAAEAEAEAKRAVQEGRVPGRAIVRDAAGRTVPAPFTLGRSKKRASHHNDVQLGAVHDGVVLPAGVSPAVLKSAVAAVASSYQAAAQHQAQHTANASAREDAELDASIASRAASSTQPTAVPAMHAASPMPRLRFTGREAGQPVLTSPPIMSAPSHRLAHDAVLPPGVPQLNGPPAARNPPAPTGSAGAAASAGKQQSHAHADGDLQPRGVPAVYVDVSLSKERTQRVPLWPDSDVAAVAAAFAAEHGLKASKAKKLQAILQAQLDAVL